MGCKGDRRRMSARAEQDAVDRCEIFGETGNHVERIAPGFFGSRVENEHLARYRWAALAAKERRVLDAACGTGYGTRMLRSAGACLVLGIDSHRPALTFARARYGVSGVVASVERMPITDS